MGIEDSELLRKLYPQKYKERELTKMLPDAPQQVLPVVTQADARNGYINRYFIRPVNDKTIITEIDSKQYERFKDNPRFVVTQLKWKITGQKETVFTPYGARVIGVKEFNANATTNADQTFGGLIYYLTDYLQYWLAESGTSLAPTVGLAPTPQPSTIIPTPAASPIILPTPTPSPSPITRKTVSVIGFANPTFGEGSTTPIASVQLAMNENAFYVGSSVTFTYELFDQRYRFINWAEVTPRQIVVGGVQTIQETEQVLSTNNTFTLTIPNNDVKIKANFRRI